MSRLPKISLAMGLSMTLISTLAAPSLAQAKDEDVYQNNESSSIYGGNENFNPFDLIHNSRFNNGRNSEQFQAETNENLDDAAANYRQSLLQYFKQQKANSSNETSPNTTLENSSTDTSPEK